jgi:DNA-directed RNA polymerase subunit RPC12/RpoP
MCAKKISNIKEWENPLTLGTRKYVCAYCSNQVASDKGYKIKTDALGIEYGGIRICPQCDMPTIFAPTNMYLSNGQDVPSLDEHYPEAAPGRAIGNLPTNIQALYDEARLSTGTGAYTAAVLVCRKILMHIGVEEGPPPGKSFVSYVEHLDKQGFLPPRGKDWVDYIRTRSNEANHEIQLMTIQDATALISFVELLLRFIYEFPELVPKPLTTSKTATTS